MEKDLIKKDIMTNEALEKKFRGPMLLSNAYGNVQSRYLKATMGSCHDLCKYGHKHDIDDEGKHTVFRKFMANNIVSDAVQNHMGNLNVGDRRKSSELKSKAAYKARVLEQNIQPGGKEVGMTEIPDEISVIMPSDDHSMARALLLEKTSIEFPLQTILQDPSVEVNHMKYLNSNKKKKKPAMKPKTSPVPEPSPVKQNKLKASTEYTSGDSPNIFKEKVASYMKESITSSALKVNRQKSTTVMKRSGSSKLPSEKKNVSLPSKNINVSVKPVFFLKVARVPPVRSVDQVNDTRNLEGSRNLDRKVCKSFKMLEVDESNFSELQKASIYTTTPVRDVVCLKARKFKNLPHATQESEKKLDDGVGIDENIWEIIETKSKNEGMIVNDENFSMEGDGYTSEPCVSELSEIDVVKRKQCRDLLEEEDKRRIRRIPAAQKKDNLSLPYKLKFKRGRVIDLRPTENYDPRRLKFRRGRVLDENSNSEVMKRTIRRRERGDMKASGSVALDNLSQASTVMLKHQDALEKKDMQALFNIVIEETASELVKTRKSKVKALVGAFETVISLQETKAAQLV